MKRSHCPHCLAYKGAHEPGCPRRGAGYAVGAWGWFVVCRQCGYVVGNGHDVGCGILPGKGVQTMDPKHPGIIADASYAGHLITVEAEGIYVDGHPAPITNIEITAPVISIGGRLPPWSDLDADERSTLMNLAEGPDEDPSYPSALLDVATMGREGMLGDDIAKLVIEHDAALRTKLLEALTPLELSMRVEQRTEAELKEREDFLRTHPATDKAGYASTSRHEGFTYLPTTEEQRKFFTDLGAKFDEVTTCPSPFAKFWEGLPVTRKPVVKFTEVTPDARAAHEALLTQAAADISRAILGEALSATVKVDRTEDVMKTGMLKATVTLPAKVDSVLVLALAIVAFIFLSGCGAEPAMAFAPLADTQPETMDTQRDADARVDVMPESVLTPADSGPPETEMSADTYDAPPADVGRITISCYAYDKVTGESRGLFQCGGGVSPPRLFAVGFMIPDSGGKTAYCDESTRDLPFDCPRNTRCVTYQYDDAGKAILSGNHPGRCE